MLSLAAALVALHAEAGAEAEAAVLHALRGVVAASVSAKLQLLASGFLPTLLARVGELRTQLLPPPAPPTLAEKAPAGTAPRVLGALNEYGTKDSTGWCGSKREREPPPRAAELLPTLQACLGLLTNTLANCAEAKLACVSLQLPLLLLQLWQLGRQLPGVRLHVLAALCNYVAHCAPAGRPVVAAAAFELVLVTSLASWD